MLALLGVTQAVGQTASTAQLAAAAAAAPRLDYDMSVAAADDAAVGGNLTSTPAAKPANDDSFDPASDEGAMTVLGATLNGHELRGDVIVTVRDGKILVPIDTLNQWRLLYSGAPILIDKQAFAPLEGVRGLTFRIDKARQQLQLTAPIESFQTTAISGDHLYAPPSQAARTAFLNYDLTIQHTSTSTVAEAFLEMGASDDRGLVENTMTVGNSPQGHKVIRLDSYVIRDDPSGLTRLTFGDTLTHIATWEQPVRFGGVKWGTDFSLQPGFLSFPTPTFNGQAQLPSNVQLYVNNVLNYQGQVDQGPFTLNRLPVVSGAGDVSVVVKDALGVEHRVTSNYYVSTDLLRPGLADYSIEAGAERQYYGRESFDYGRAFLAGSFRYGLTPTLTLETRAEGAGDIQDVGGGFSTLVGNIGELGGAVAASRGPDGSGYLYRVYASRTGPHWSLSASYQNSSRDFAQLGLDKGVDHPREILQATAGANSIRWGSLTANISYLRLNDGTKTAVQTVTYGHQLGRLGYFNAFVLRTKSNGQSPDVSAGASLSVALGPRRTGYVQIDSDSRRADIQQNLPDDKGWGYRLSVSQGQTNQQEGELDYRGRAIDLSADVSRFNGQLGERLLASGGFVLSGSSILPTRHLDDSFAIVDVGGQPGVRVYQENRQVATTNGAGIAIVTNLRPYEANRISVAPDDLQLDSTIRNDNLMVVPRFLSGVKASFQVSAGHAGTVIVVLPDGQPLEPGTDLSFSDGDGTFYSGFDGEVFIDTIAEGKVLVARLKAGACSVTLPAVAKGVELPRIGPLTCRPIEAAK
jgi:outer membrane usher protein